jgi:hypothetical protein
MQITSKSEKYLKFCDNSRDIRSKYPHSKNKLKSFYACLILVDKMFGVLDKITGALDFC